MAIDTAQNIRLQHIELYGTRFDLQRYFETTFLRFCNYDSRKLGPAIRTVVCLPPERSLDSAHAPFQILEIVSRPVINQIKIYAGDCPGSLYWLDSR